MAVGMACISGPWLVHARVLIVFDRGGARCPFRAYLWATGSSNAEITFQRARVNAPHLPLR